jgi:phospholipid/cholesterol/gamma-HCH transport system substrate-binding protein
MRFAIKHAEKIVGLFVLIAVVMLAGVVIFLGANQRWFSRNINYYTVFESAKGLNRGMPITFKGFEIGKVSSFELTDDNKVVLHYYIYYEYHSRVHRHSLLELTSSPLGSSLLFYPGKEKTEPLGENSLIPAIDSAAGRDILLAKQVDIPEKAEDSLSAILQNVDEITSQINDLVKNNAAELDNIVKSLSRTTVALADAMEGRPTGPLGRSFNDLNVIVRNLRDLTADMNGLIPKLLDPTGQEVYPAIQRILSDIEQATEKLKGFIDFISGTAPQITGILEQGRDVLNKGKDVLEGLSNNPLLRGGITKEREQPSTFKSFRDEEF